MIDLKNTILITHKNCIDGSGCAIMFLHSGGLLENIRFVSAGGVDAFIMKEGVIGYRARLLFVDVCPSSKVIIDGLEKRGYCSIIDHHKSSMCFSDRDWMKIDVNACGTELLRRHLKSTDVSDMILSSLIDDFDRWKNVYPDSTKLATLMNFYGQKEFIERFVNRNLCYGICTKWEEPLLSFLKKKDDADMDDAINSVIVKDVIVDGMGTLSFGYIVSDNRNTSGILNELLKRRDDVDVACKISLHDGSVSFRSKGDIDVSKIAKIYGGAGHLAAAGHPLPRELISNLIEDIH